MQISILLPVFNTEPYLPECLESILAQTERDWELIAIDDHSTDGSWVILQKFAERDKRVKIFKNPGAGIAPALRFAFGKSNGRLVTRMDSDDVMLPQKLAVMKSALRENGPGHLAVGQVEYFAAQAPPSPPKGGESQRAAPPSWGGGGAWGLGPGYRRYAEWLNNLTAEGENFTDIYKECPIPSPCWMAHREDLENASAFQTDIYPEDYDLAFRLRQIGLAVIPCREILHRWRDRPDRASRTDANYRDNTFLHLKVDWFLRSDHDATRPLVLWGAGKKGKRIARLLNERGVSFGWVTNNQEKIGHEIRGVELREVNVLRQLKNPQIIVAVASPTDQDEILDFFREMDFLKGENYFFFC